MGPHGGSKRREFLKSMAAVPAAWRGLLGGSSGAPEGPAAPPDGTPGARRRIALSDGWRIKELPPGTSDPAKLVLEAAAPDASWLPARIPAQVHEVLLAHGRISDPFVGKNAEASAWVGERDWAYALAFDAPPASGGPAFLRFEGLDTLAAVYLNGREIGRFDNMFREHVVDVREALAPAGGGNTLLIVFSSPLRFIERYPQPDAHRGVISKPKYLRKSFGDFGSYLGARPHSVKVGVHRDIVLDIPDKAWIEDVWIRTELRPDHGEATLRVCVETSGCPCLLSWKLRTPEGSEAGRGALTAKAGTTEFQAEIKGPKLWWPRTHGAPDLYRLEVALSEGSRRLDVRETAVGIREVRLVREDPATGEKRFRFEVNGRPVSLFGACWTPVDGLTHCWPREKALRLLDLAEAASMNAFRIWAEGYIPPPEFYDECDRRGILVWQDFMFGYGMHPAGIPEYDANCRAEIEGLVRRLRNHPSLLIWVGGNENHMALDFAGIRSDIGRDLFEEVMPGICGRLDPTRPFHPSSPFGGPVPNWPLEGDFHDYTAESFSPEASVPTFTSEVGRVTPPPLRNMRRFLSEEEIWPPGFDARVREPGRPAWPPMWHYRTFDDGWTWAAPFDGFCEPRCAADLIRVLGTAHGEHLRQRIERQRRGVADGAAVRGRRSGGNLVWCYNDGRPVIQFGLVDHWQEPKLPYYFVRRAYAPVLLSFERAADAISLWVVNDSPGPASGTLVARRMTFDGKVLGEATAGVAVAPGEARRCLDLTGFGPILLRREFLWAGLNGLETTFLLIGERYLELPRAKLSLLRTGSALVVSTDVFARQVALDVEEGPGLAFEDNAFDLPPGGRRALPLPGGSSGRRVVVSALNADPVRAEL